MQYKRQLYLLIIASAIISLVTCIGCGAGYVKSDKYETGLDEIAEEKTEGKRGYKSSKEKKSGSSKDRTASARRRGASGLKAGYVDDNKQYNRFLEFLEKYKKRAFHYPFRIEERIILRVKDRNKKSIPNAVVNISGNKKTLFTGKTFTDGTCLFFPSEYSRNISRYNASITFNQVNKKLIFNRNGRREINIDMNLARPAMQQVPLDILFIFDTTGSMGEEIARLKRTIEVIYLNLSSLSSRPNLRFGMVLYKDRKDKYITKIVPFTGKIKQFQKELNKVRADGGGDYPEDLQSALKDSIKKMKWNSDGIRLGFIITDAPPHFDYKQEYTYRDAAADSQKSAIKIFSIGTGGLDIRGEYVLRQIAHYTYGKYIFLTYGEKGESEGGRPGSVSHHTGANFSTDKLESIIIRFAKKELSYLTDTPLEDGEPYFEANRIEDEEKKETLKKLFDMAISQLIDYSSISIPDKTGTAVLPISTAGRVSSLKLNAEYFTEQLILSLSKKKRFRMVERKDLQKILKELSLKMTGLVDLGSASKVGKIMGAKMLILGKLYKKKKHYELFIKLLRVETSEIIAVTKARIALPLGL